MFLTKSGALGVVLALDGVDYECLDPQQREAVTTRFEVALRLWDERTRLSQYVLKRNARRAVPTTPIRIPPSTRCSGAGRRTSRRTRRTLFTVSLYLVVVVETEPSDDGLGESGATRSRVSRSPCRREWFSTARTIVRLDEDLDRRRVQLRHKVDAFVQQLEDTVAPAPAVESARRSRSSGVS